MGQVVGVGAGSITLPPNVSRSTIAVQSLGSVKVLPQPVNDSFEAIATEFFYSRPQRNVVGIHWNSS
ncbi:hypothetical protein [Kribbella sp. CA-294648]|uniref:hypothetical protein n=1 Tax=Kribbella sp. CA-294648 TaxID=3239948 RepID=UPI003D93641E